jgi:RNA polymerase sigma factor (sigma-70 family)
MIRGTQTLYRDDVETLHAAIVEALPSVRRFARALTGNATDADDLLQSTVERTLARARPDGLDVLKWMFRVCRNLWVDELRARNVRERAPANAIEPHATEDGAMIDALAVDEVMAAIAQLPEEQRAVLALVVGEGMSYREAAQALDIPQGTIMSRLSRARAALADRFGGRRAT